MNKHRRYPSHAYRLCLRRRKNGAVQLEQLSEEYLPEFQEQGADSASSDSQPAGAERAGVSRTPVACWVLSRDIARARSGLRFLPSPLERR